MMVGIAKVGNSTPRLSSNRSIALIRPMVPTWMMSSIGSLRERNREAANFTRARFSSTRVLRTYACSCVPSSRDSRRAKSVLDRARGVDRSHLVERRDLRKSFEPFQFFSGQFLLGRRGFRVRFEPGHDLLPHAGPPVVRGLAVTNTFPSALPVLRRSSQVRCGVPARFVHILCRPVPAGVRTVCAGPRHTCTDRVAAPNRRCTYCAPAPDARPDVRAGGGSARGGRRAGATTVRCTDGVGFTGAVTANQEECAWTAGWSARPGGTVSASRCCDRASA